MRQPAPLDRQFSPWILRINTGRQSPLRVDLLPGFVLPLLAKFLWVVSPRAFPGWLGGVQETLLRRNLDLLDEGADRRIPYLGSLRS